MIYNPYYTKQFKKDYKNCEKEGKDIDLMDQILKNITNGKRLAYKYRLHKLKGNYVGSFECHIEPDWLLIYKKEGDSIYFERTGSHAKLFG